MPDLYDSYYQLLIYDLVNDPVVSLTDPIAFLSGELFTAQSAWVVGECVYAFENAFNIGLRNIPQVFVN